MMKYIKLFFGVILLIFSVRGHAINEIENITPAQAFEKGRVLRLQHEIQLAGHYLKYAADQGHLMAALMYADELATLTPYIRRQEEILHYTMLSARGGNVWAMNRLAETQRIEDEELRSYWQKQYHSVLLERANNGNAKAMLTLFYQNLEVNYERAKMWLKKALATGYQPAKMAEIELVENGREEWFFLPVDRQTEVIFRYALLANSGYLPAIKKIIHLFLNTGKTHLVVEWFDKAVELGDANSLALAAKAYAGNYPQTRVKVDLVKSATYYAIYLDAMGTDKLKGTYKRIQKAEQIIKGKMTPEQLSSAQQAYLEYMKYHQVAMYESPWKYSNQ